MSDMGFFFGPNHPGTQIFYANHAAAATAPWQLWDKPRGCQMVFMAAYGGGGGGGAGLTGIATASRGGGGGGGSASSSTLLVPAVMLPDRLYLQVGKGGPGAAASGSAGTGGQTTNVQLWTVGNGVSVIAAVGGGAGGAGTNTIGGAGGGAGSSGAGTAQFCYGTALATQKPGAGGVAGGAPGVAASFSFFGGGSGAGASPGVGGGGVTSADTAGGKQASPAVSFVPDVPVATGAVNGAPGYWTWGPQFVGGPGGSGGGGSNASVGGVGGAGVSFGSGGGGGGGGTTGGAGGAGGDGLIVIVAY